MITSSPVSQSQLPLFHSNSTQSRRSLATASATATAMGSSPSSFYDVLGIPMGASSDEVKTAFRRLARVCHPDVATKDTSSDEFMRIHTAYSTLSDPTKRANYDRQMFRRHRSFTALSASASSVCSSPFYTRRNWETDQCW